MAQLTLDQVIRIVGWCEANKDWLQSRLAEAKRNPDTRADIINEIKPELVKIARLYYTLASRNGYTLNTTPMTDQEIDDATK